MRRGHVGTVACWAVLTGLAICAAGCQQRPDGSANVSAGSRNTKAAASKGSGDDPKEKLATRDDAPAEPQAASSDPPKAPAEETQPKETPAPKPAAQKNPLAGCQQCHVDIEDEYKPSLHFKEKVACTECHGPSTGHLADENNEVKPDEVFARKDVDRLCERCHECGRPAEVKRIPKSSPEYKVCTDCHGPHDLKPAGKQSARDPAESKQQQ